VTACPIPCSPPPHAGGGGESCRPWSFPQCLVCHTEPWTYESGHDCGHGSVITRAWAVSSSSSSVPYVCTGIVYAYHRGKIFINASANAGRLWGVYQNIYQNGTVSNQLTDVLGGGGGVYWRVTSICWYTVITGRKIWKIDLCSLHSLTVSLRMTRTGGFWQRFGSGFIDSGSGSSILGLIPIRIRIQSLHDQKLNKYLQLKNFWYFFSSKTAIYLWPC
jgi:hypothetical protein